jgi:hypothetical protein
MKKKIIVILFVLATIFGFTGCLEQSDETVTVQCIYNGEYTTFTDIKSYSYCCGRLIFTTNDNITISTNFFTVEHKRD